MDRTWASTDRIISDDRSRSGTLIAYDTFTAICDCIVTERTRSAKCHHGLGSYVVERIPSEVERKPGGVVDPAKRDVLHCAILYRKGIEVRGCESVIGGDPIARIDVRATRIQSTGKCRVVTINSKIRDRNTIGPYQYHVARLRTDGPTTTARGTNERWLYDCGSTLALQGQGLVYDDVLNEGSGACREHFGSCGICDGISDMAEYAMRRCSIVYTFIVGVTTGRHAGFQ